MSVRHWLTGEVEKTATAREKALTVLNAWEGFHAGILEDWASRGVEPEEFLKSGPALWEKTGLAGNARELLSRLLGSSWPERELGRASALGVRLTFWGDEDYPRGLFDLVKPPVVLYSRGGWPPPGKMDGVVGTRRCSSYGERIARSVSARLTEGGRGVLSGGALGIDGAAHAGTLEAGGMTVAVLGTGVDVVYPSGHKTLFDRIIERGTLLSEFPLSTRARPWRFPRRNRLIAALSDRLIVIEAPEKSGAIVTARLALEMGREVWAVPGRMDEWGCRGSNGLLWDGAHPLVDLDDLVRIAEPAQGRLFAREIKKENSSPVLEALQLFGDQTVDILASRVRMSAADILVELSRMEAFGRVRCSVGGRWSVILSQGT